MDANKSSSASPSYVFVVASTNRVDATDPALRRSGRFDAEFEVTTPTEDERLQILKLYAKNVSLDKNVNLRASAASCNGYVGADLLHLCRVAVMNAIRRTPSLVISEDILTTEEDWNHARSEVKPSITKGVTVEIPKVSWDDIAGYNDLKKELQKAVEWPIRYANTFTKLGISPIRGVLLHGPPGCSKTTLAKAAAHTRFFALGCYAVLLMPGFLQVGYSYYISLHIKRNIVYGDQPRNRLDLYLPKDSNGQKAVVAFVTGGAWIIG